MASSPSPPPIPITDNLKKRKLQLNLNLLSLLPQNPKFWRVRAALHDCEMEAIEEKYTATTLKHEAGKLSLKEWQEQTQFYRKNLNAYWKMKFEVEKQHDLLAMRIANTPQTPDNQPDVKEAFINMMLAAVTKYVRTRHIQQEFAQNLIIAYGAAHSSKTADNTASAWRYCPVLQSYDVPALRPATHLFPFHLGQEAMETIFEPSAENTIFSVCNGLILDKSISEKFNKFQLSIVPVNADEEDPKRWKIRIMNPDIQEERIKKGEKKFKELEGAELNFLSHHRPGARFLYWQYVVALLYICRGKSARELGAKEIVAMRYIWATPGKYIRRNMLHALAQYIPHDVRDELLPVPPLPSLDNAEMPTPEMDEMAYQIACEPYGGQLGVLGEELGGVILKDE